MRVNAWMVATVDQEKLLMRCEATDCDTVFQVKKPWQRFCSPRCRFNFHNSENRQLIAMAKAFREQERAALREQAKTLPTLEPTQ